MKHTPGPWITHSRIPSSVLSARGDVIANCVGRHDPETMNANAKVIAAAPKMLDALEAVLDMAGDCFRDVWRGGGHDTEHFCPMCNCTTGHEEDCPMPKVIEAIKTARGEK